MKTTTRILALLLVLCVCALTASADITTGWQQTEAGAQQFLEPSNWVGGNINGVFSSDWSSSTSNTHVFRLTNDWTGTIQFLGSINKEVTFAGFDVANSKSESRTITLDGDLVLTPAAAQYTDSRLTFDAAVRFDLGCATRNIFVDGNLGTKLRVNGQMTNGNIVLNGAGGGMSFLASGAIDGDVLLKTDTTLAFDYPGAETEVCRVKDIDLHRATISANTHNYNHTSKLAKVTVDGSDAPGVSFIQAVHNNKVAVLESESLSITNGGTLAVMANDLAADSEATKGTHVLFTTAPALCGAGTLGANTAPILKGVVVGVNSTLSNIAGTYGSNQPTLATYDTTLGVRKLSDSETCEAVSVESAVNLVVPSSTTLELESDATVNSLQLRASAYNSSSQKIAGDVKLSVLSGMVLATAPKDGAKIDVSLDFGSALGYVVSAGSVNYAVNITKPVYGSAGIVLSKCMVTSYDTTIAPSSSARGFAISTSADEGTYTGDTWIQCIVDVGSSPFLPHGNRSGNVIVNGSLNFGTISVNGLYGSGAVRGTTLIVGEDGSDSAFSGSVILTSALNVTNGTFVLDGTVTQGKVNVAEGAAISGSGTIQTTLSFADGAVLAVSIADDVAKCLNVTGAVSGGEVTVNVSTTGTKWKTAQCVLKSEEAMTATFKKGTGIGAVSLRNGDTELWAGPKASGFAITMR